MTGTFYIVATPIGNLEDITLRALRILKEVDIILAEDTRITSRLTTHYQLPTTILSYHQHSSEDKKLEILKLLLDGKNIALVTDAGTPGVSDPGNELIDYLLSYQPDLQIVPIPGASAITTALSVSGFKTNNFIFLGFFPKKKKERLIKWIKEGRMSFAFYESPFRITKTLEFVKSNFGDVRVFVARELTKIHESLYRGKLSDVIDKLSNEKHIKGEIVVIVEVDK